MESLVNLEKAEMSILENSVCLTDKPCPVSPNLPVSTESPQISKIASPDLKPAASADLPRGLKRKVLDKCVNCGTNETPLWRRGPSGEIICNACGLWLKSRNNPRPSTLKIKSRQRRQLPNSSTPQTATSQNLPLLISQLEPQILRQSYDSHPSINIPANLPILKKIIEIPSIETEISEQPHQKPALHCVNCNTTSTPLWRRDERGNTICNACGLYFRLHNIHRPTNLKSPSIKRRKRVAPLPLLPAPSAPGVELTPAYSVDCFDKPKEKLTNSISSPQLSLPKFMLPPLGLLEGVNGNGDLIRKRDFWKIDVQTVDTSFLVFGSDFGKNINYGLP
ncbi:putative electron transfer flavoprotein subunit, partial [Nowakowskiella sp. JEL0078]